MPGLSTVDEVNERFYREYKDRPWASILESFRASYQRVLATVEGMSEESLHAPTEASCTVNAKEQLRRQPQ